jgi:uncharacterized protein DUF4255
MAGPDVIRDTGDTIVELLQAGIPSAVVNPARIVLATPDEFDGLQNPPQPTLTVFLYRVALHCATRNAARRLTPDGRVQRQPLPLELNFMITPWARETRAELLMAGRVLQVMHDHGELGPADLVGASWEPTDSVQIVFDSLPLEDHYRIWDANHDVSYRLSLMYTARVISIAATQLLAEPPVIDALLRIGVT